MATLTENINYLQPTSFKLVVDRQNYPNLEFFCQSVSHPDVQIGSADVAFRNVSPVAFGGDKFIFGELTVNLLLDEDMQAYDEMFNWMKRIVERQNTTALEKDQDNIPSSSDITLLILSSHNNLVKKVSYRDAVPIGLGNINFETTSGGTEFLTVPVTFRYNYFDVI